MPIKLLATVFHSRTDGFVRCEKKKKKSNAPDCIFFINILTDIDDKKETPYLINQLQRDIDEQTHFRYYLVWTSTFDSLVSCPQSLFHHIVHISCL